MARHFDSEGTRKYDHRIRKVMPGYEVLHGLARSLLRLDLKERAHLLIVGAGTGMEVVHLGEDNPGWRFTGVDPSTDMLAVARRRMVKGGLSGRVELHAGFAQELPASESYDAATLILVMHFIPDDGEKLELLRSISARLAPGAPLILADLHGDKNSDRFARFIAAWRRRQLTLGMTSDDVKEMFEHLLSNVHFVPEERIVGLMYEAGFGDIEPFYGAFLLGGWVARRAGDTRRCDSASVPDDLE